MNSLLLATSLLWGHATIATTLDGLPRAEPAIAIVDEMFLAVTERTVTTDEPMGVDEGESERDRDAPTTGEPPRRSEPVP